MSHFGTLKNQQNLALVIHYYEAVIESMPHLVYVLDEQGSLVICNKNMKKLLGANFFNNSENNLYYSLMTAAQWSEERVQLLKRDDMNAMLAEEPVKKRIEQPVITAGNAIIFYQSLRTVLYDENRNVIGMVVVLMDVTTQKKLEDKINKLQQQHNPDFDLSTNFAKETNELQPRILLVEDNSLAQKAAQSLLMQLDCWIDVVGTEEEAAKLFQPGKYDIVLMDIGLENSSGYVVAKKIRQMERRSDHQVPIIALTSFQADVVKYDCAAYNMEGAITKPLTLEQAKQIIQHYIYHVDIPIHGLKSSKGLPKSDRV